MSFAPWLVSRDHDCRIAWTIRTQRQLKLTSWLQHYWHSLNIWCRFGGRSTVVFNLYEDYIAGSLFWGFCSPKETKELNHGISKYSREFWEGHLVLLLLRTRAFGTRCSLCSKYWDNTQNLSELLWDFHYESFMSSVRWSQCKGYRCSFKCHH